MKEVSDRTFYGQRKRIASFPFLFKRQPPLLRQGRLSAIYFVE